jgi:hypothetical protein
MIRWRRLIAAAWFFAASCGGGRPAIALDVGGIIRDIRVRIADMADPKQRYSDAYLYALVNEAQREIVNMTAPVTKHTTQELSVRTTYYTLPVDLVGIVEARFTETTTGRTRLLEEKNKRSLYQENPDWERQAGSPMSYFVRQATSTAANITGQTRLEFAITPVPSTTTTLGTVTFEYYYYPAALSAETDIPFSGRVYLSPYHPLLVNYVVSQIKMIEGDVTGAAAYRKMYDDMLVTMAQRVRDMPNYNPGFRGSGR